MRGLTAAEVWDSDTLHRSDVYWFAVTAIAAAGETSNSEPLMGRDGTISQGATQIAQLGLSSFLRPGAMDKIGDNLWLPTNEQGTPSTDTQVIQGMTEGSNVVAVTELTRIMEISRAFESASRIQKNAEDLRSRAIDRLARVQS